VIADRYIDKTIDELKCDRAALELALKEAGATIKGRAICCFCGDKHPSAGIYEPNGEGYRYKCHKCGFNGSIIDVIAKVDGISVEDVFNKLKHTNTPAYRNTSPKVYANIEELKAAMPCPVEDVYQYTHPVTGKLEMMVLRLKTSDGKQFRQASPAGSGFIQHAPAKPWPLYNRTRIQTVDIVVVVEGEKCVHVLQKYGIIATTSPCGAGKAQYADWAPLAGKNVILWPDNDAVGNQHMQDVELILQSLDPAPHVSWLNPVELDLKEKEDVVDFIEQFEAIGADEIRIQSEIFTALSKSKPRGISAGVGKLIEDMISGRRENIKWPWSRLSSLAKALLPGTVAIICGNVGASKSFMLLQSTAHWYECNVKSAVYELEEDRDYHLSRCLAQKTETAGLTDDEWVKINPEKARALYAEYRNWLDRFGACVYAKSDTQPTLEQLIEWVRDRAKAGCRVIAIDPITVAAHKGRNTWDEDNSFLHNIKHIAVDYKCSVVLVTHPIKSVSLPDVTQLAGGAAYQRFAQTIIWLERHDEKTSKVSTLVGTTAIDHNLTLHILKSRNGKGTGIRLAYSFEKESLTLSERGIIVKKKKNE
jgi:hypothetical protein